MAQILSRGFRLVYCKDLSDLTKAEVNIEQIREISHDGGQEIEGRKYEDSIVDNVKIRKSLTGNITLKGDLEHYIYPSYAGGSRTDPLFEPDHYYLLRFLSLNVMSGVTKMVYNRWIGQYVDISKENKQAGELADHEIVLAITMFGTKSYAFEKFYIATADGDPGPADATPTDDYNPIFSAEMADTTKTLAAAETILATVVNPF